MFKPSRRILDAFGHEAESLAINGYYEHPLPESYSSREEVDLRLNLLKPSYQATKDFWETVRLVGVELLENSRVHGCKGRGRFGLITLAGRRGVINGAWDEGEFLRNPSVKEQVEARKRIRNDQHDIGDVNGFREGMNIVRLLSDELEVDTTNGVIWAGHYLPGIGEE